MPTWLVHKLPTEAPLRLTVMPLLFSRRGLQTKVNLKEPSKAPVKHWQLSPKTMGLSSSSFHKMAPTRTSNHKHMKNKS